MPMNLLERVLTLLHANLNTVIEKANDPEQVLRKLQLDMRNQLVQVKTQVATAIAESHRLRKHSQEKTVEAEAWLKKAEQAIQQDNDQAARSALARYNEINQQTQRYKEQQKTQDQLVATMRGALHQLEAKISEVDTTIDLLITRKRNALIQQRVFDALNKTRGVSQDKEQTTTAQDAVLEAEARARTLANLHKRDLDTQLNQLSTEQMIEEQLQALKKMKHPSQGSELLQEDISHTSSLQHPQAGEPAYRRAKKPLRKDRSTADLPPLDTEHLKRLLDMPQNIPSKE